MADKEYAYLDEDMLDHLILFLLTTLKTSPLANNTTYSIAAKTDDPSTVVLTGSDGSTTNVTIPKTEIPTTVSAFTNDAKYQNETQVNDAINAAIGKITGVSFEVHDTFAALPATGTAGVFYLVPDTHSDSNDTYDEYFWDTNGKKYEKFGNTDVDLSGYVKSAQLKTLTTAQVESAVTTAYNSVFGS